MNGRGQSPPWMTCLLRCLWTGEILGIAGIAGSGQKELCEVISGLIPRHRRSQCCIPARKTGFRFGENLLGVSPDVIVQKGVSMSLCAGGSPGHGTGGQHGYGGQCDAAQLQERQGHRLWTANPLGNWPSGLIGELEIATPGVDTPVGRLSGGNVQKVLLGREIACNPSGADRGLPGAGSGHQLLLPHL